MGMFDDDRKALEQSSVEVICMYCGQPPVLEQGFIMVDGGTAYHQHCPAVFAAAAFFEQEDRFYKEIVEETLVWISDVQHYGDIPELIPHEEIISKARKKVYDG